MSTASVFTLVHTFLPTLNLSPFAVDLGSLQTPAVTSSPLTSSATKPGRRRRRRRRRRKRRTKRQRRDQLTGRRVTMLRGWKESRERRRGC